MDVEQSRKQQPGTEPLPNLPQEIIVQILLNLPVKSLLRFRCVSKSWLSLISSGDFIRNHLKKSSNNTKYAYHSLLLSSSYIPGKFYTCSLYSILHENAPIHTELDLDSRLLDPYPLTKIVGSCNGLFCIFEQLERVFILWNPSTRKSIILNSCAEMQSFSYFVYGFGYDEVDDDYKVVEIHSLQGDHFGSVTEVNICSLTTKSWRSSKINTDHKFTNESAVFFNGVLHWGLASHAYMVTCDLVKETFGEMALPYTLEDAGYNVDSSMGILEECLTMIYNYHPARTDIWVMKEYGVNKSWSKLISITYNEYFVAYASPIIERDNGELLLKVGTSMILYDTRNNTFKNCFTIQSPEGPIAGVEPAAFSYVESLVSLDS